MLGLLIAVVVTVSSVWVYLDATNHRIGKLAEGKGLFNLSAGGWATVTLLLWIVGFPCYLAKREDLIWKAKKSPVVVSGRAWKTLVLLAVGGYFITGQAFIVLLGGEDVQGKQVQASRKDAASMGYSTDADGLVSSILDERFYLQRKKLRLNDEDDSGFALIEDGYLSICSSRFGCVETHALEVIDEKKLPLCRSTDINEAMRSAGSWIMICTSIVPLPVREIESHGYKSSETIPAGSPWVLIWSFRSGVQTRSRFSVEDGI